jgi:hypothetical protein
MVMRPDEPERVRVLLERLEALDAAQPRPEEVAITEIARAAIADEITALLGCLGRSSALASKPGMHRIGKAC